MNIKIIIKPNTDWEIDSEKDFESYQDAINYLNAVEDREIDERHEKVMSNN